MGSSSVEPFLSVAKGLRGLSLSVGLVVDADISRTETSRANQCTKGGHKGDTVKGWVGKATHTYITGLKN